MTIIQKTNVINKIIVLLLVMLFCGCIKPDNQLIIYNGTTSALTIEHHVVNPGNKFIIFTEGSYTLHHLLNAFHSVSVSISDSCVAQWNKPIISRPDSECHSFFNLQSWEEKHGGRNDRYMRFTFTITEEDLKQNSP